MAEKQSIKRFIVRDPHGHIEKEDSFSVVGEVHVDIVPGYGEPYAESVYVNGILTITIHNIEGNGITEITTNSQEGDEAVNTVTIKTNANPEGVTLEVRNGSRGNGIASSSEVLSPEDGGTNTHTITDTDGNEHVFHTKNGRKGDKGDQGDSAVYDPSAPDTPDFVMANTTGQSTTKAMTQKAVTDYGAATTERIYYKLSLGAVDTSGAITTRDDRIMTRLYTGIWSGEKTFHIIGPALTKLVCYGYIGSNRTGVLTTATTVSNNTITITSDGTFDNIAISFYVVSGWEDILIYEDFTYLKNSRKELYEKIQLLEDYVKGCNLVIANANIKGSGTWINSTTGEVTSTGSSWSWTFGERQYDKITCWVLSKSAGNVPSNGYAFYNKQGTYISGGWNSENGSLTIDIPDNAAKIIVNLPSNTSSIGDFSFIKNGLHSGDDPDPEPVAPTTYTRYYPLKWGGVDSADGEVTLVTNRFRTDYIRVFKGLKLSWPTSVVSLMQMLGYDENQDYLQRVTIASGAASYTFDGTENCEFVRIAFYIGSGKDNEESRAANFVTGEVDDSSLIQALFSEDLISQEKFRNFSIPDVPKQNSSDDEFNLNNTTVAQMYDKWDALVTSHPSSISLVATETDSSGNYQLRRYKVDYVSPIPYTAGQNIKPKRIAVMVANVHGYLYDARNAAFALYWLIKNYLTSEEPFYCWLRENYIFDVVPIGNPYGFDSGSRGNYNDVNINRNFDTGYWREKSEDDVDSCSSWGSSAASEVETQFVQSILDERKGTVYLFVDIHAHPANDWHRQILPVDKRTGLHFRPLFRSLKCRYITSRNAEQLQPTEPDGQGKYYGLKAGAKWNVLIECAPANYPSMVNFESLQLTVDQYLLSGLLSYE